MSYGQEERIAVRDLVEGDWICVIPTQGGIRGKKVESGVSELVAGEGYVRRFGRGRRSYPVDSRVISTRRATIHVPSDFEVVVRREVSA